mgnify:CR=1 FL=1
MMNEKEKITVSVPLDEYKELLAKAERIAVAERMANSANYFTPEEVYTILGIEVKEDKQ